ncbi:hypothetical protein N6H14_01805 [Paenibacillus sp. CC-CFT747]|nr:hypothetical protein N6H14_01805 [Paenibacillus sp. CC-CFT747]
MDHRELAGGMDERQPENGKREESDLMQLVEIMNNPQHEADGGFPVRKPVRMRKKPAGRISIPFKESWVEGRP